jgi:hypothetical protein
VKNSTATPQQNNLHTFGFANPVPNQLANGAVNLSLNYSPMFGQ